MVIDLLGKFYLNKGAHNLEIEKVPLKERISYGLGDVASNLVFVTVSSYLAYFYTDIFGISAAVVGTLLLFSRVFDAINDPIIGVIVDRTNTKWGKSRPYFLWFSIPFVILAVLTFYTPDLSVTGKIVYAFITYNLLNILYSLINLPLSTILPSLTSDPQERTVLNSFRMAGGQIGGFIVNLGALPMVSLLGRGNQQNGFIYTMILFGIIAATMYFITFANTRERVQPKGGHKSVPLKESVKALKGNIPWLIMLVVNFTYWNAYTVKTQTTPYYLQYNLDRMELVPILNGLTGIMVLAMIIVPLITKRIQKKRTMMIGYVVAGIGQFIVFLGAESVFLLIIGNAICFFGLGMVNGLIYAMVADTIDYGEWKSGVRAPGLLATSASFGFKFGMGIGGAIPIWIMSATGYVANQEQTTSTLIGIQFNFVWIPLFFIVLGFISLLFYRFDEVEETVIYDLKEKHG